MDPIAYCLTRFGHIHVQRLARALHGADERGAALVEYALLVVLIAVACIGAITVLGTNLQTHYSQVGSAIQ